MVLQKVSSGFLVGDYHALVYRHDSLMEHIHNFPVMSYEHNCCSKLVYLPKKFDNIMGVDCIQITCRFISDEDLWAMNECSGDDRSLLLAAGYLTLKTVHFSFESDYL